jgi:ABC-type phosphate transport system substrate-binding protein
MSASGIQGQSFVVVVNAANPVSSLTKAQLSAIFMKKTTKWGDDKPVVPVNQSGGAKIRDVFSKATHGRSAAAIEIYWQTQIFSGNDVPPLTKANDADVLAFVQANPNAIGYVSAGAKLGTKVKAVTISGL